MDDDKLPYPAIEIVERAVRMARPQVAQRSPRWVAVKEALGYGSTTSKELCERFGLDPYEVVVSLNCYYEDDGG